MNQFTFQVPSRIIAGPGTVDGVGEESRRFRTKKALVVTDEFMVKENIAGRVTGSLKSKGLEHVIYDGVNTEPSLEIVSDGISMYKKNQCDFVVAVGGGSPIDAAKAIAVMVNNVGLITDYRGLDNIPLPAVPLLCVPTTAGTGSEATRFTIISDTDREEKILVGSPHLVPLAAVVDPVLTLTLPRSLTAATGLDALTHAIEAYVSTRAQPMSDIYALAAVELIYKNLGQAWANGNNLQARERTMLGALYAGIAFSNSSVALVHGMSRPIGANFHIAHGLSNAVLLGAVMEFSVIGNLGRYARLAEVMGESQKDMSIQDKAQCGVAAVKRLIQDVEIPSLPELGVDGKRFEALCSKMTAEALASGSPGNNPRLATREEIVGLYHRVYSSGG